MKEIGVYGHWLLSANGYNAGTGTIYFGRNCDNTPEIMPWDESLNHDLHDKVADYTGISSFLKKDKHPQL